MRFRLIEHGTVFSTRPRGRKLKQEVSQSLGKNDVLELSLVDIEALSYSFTDEFIGALLQDLHPESRMRLVDVPAPLRRVIAASAERRGVDATADELFAQPV